jgi:uncharacterized protein (DUF302 family)
MSAEVGFEIHLNYPYEEALEKTKAALKIEGFGVLTSIDVRATMKEKLDVDFRPYSILGACNPPLAHRALSEDAVAGLFLPCNVTVEATDKNSSIVRISNPQVMLTVGDLKGNPELSHVAHEARERLERVAESLLTS